MHAILRDSERYYTDGYKKCKGVLGYSFQTHVQTEKLQYMAYFGLSL